MDRSVWGSMDRGSVFSGHPSENTCTFPSTLSYIYASQYILMSRFILSNCNKTLLKIILRFKKLLKSDDVSTLAKRHYQVKICE